MTEFAEQSAVWSKLPFSCHAGLSKLCGLEAGNALLAEEYRAALRWSVMWWTTLHNSGCANVRNMTPWSRNRRRVGWAHEHFERSNIHKEAIDDPEELSWQIIAFVHASTTPRLRS